MFWFFAKHYAAGKIKFEEGFISFLGQRMLFLPTVSVNDMQNLLIKEFGEQKGSFLTYNVFKAGGLSYADFVRNKIDLEGVHVAKWMEQVACASGWGKVKIIDFDDKRFRSIIEIEHSPFVQRFQSRGYACNPTRGLIAGTLSGLFNKEIEGVERVCAATGKKKCSMIFQPKSAWQAVKSPDLIEAAKRQLPNVFRKIEAGCDGM